MNSSTLPSPYPAPGEIIGDSWQVEKILGEGGMGAVARAWDLILHTPVAIKFMNPQYLSFPGAEERFINEGKASALIKSDHVVPVMKAGKTSTGTPYLVMECLEGADLSQVLSRDGHPGLPLERAVHFVLQVLRALQAAHAIGIVHRDMKPSNCFAVTKDGEEDFVKILDFGISKIQQPGSVSLTQTNSALGTPLYMSPEQARSPRDVDARSDLYSVGVILYELLTGQTPFASETGEFTEILFKLFTAEPPPIQTVRPDLPDTLATAVHTALAREVSERFASALEMAESLAPFARERSQNVLTRMRAFKAPRRASVAAPADLPQSMVAFSKLQQGSQTDAMAGRPAVPDPKLVETQADLTAQPTATVPKQLETLALSGAPGAGVGILPPRLVDARALVDSPVATKSAGSGSPNGPLGGVPLEHRSHSSLPGARSPLVFALPIITVVAMGVAAFTFTRGPAKPLHNATSTGDAVTSTGTATSFAQPAASALASTHTGINIAAPIAPVIAASSSVLSIPNVSSAPIHGPTPPPRVPSHGLSPNVLDTTIHQ